jgi:hypothetical protein
VVIEAKGRDVALFQASMGRIANLTLRQGGGKGIWFGVDIAQGRLHLEVCDITSQSIACVEIHGGADPRLLRNRIYDVKMLASMWTTTARGRWRTTTSSATLFDMETIHSLGIGVISEVDATMPPELPEASTFQDDDGTEGWIR